MSRDHKANVLYNRHLDFSVTDGNKELEDAKGNYLLMKSILLEKWGVADIVCYQYLEGIRRIKMPSDPKDKVGMLTYVKNAYSRLVTLTKLEVDRGQLVPGLEDYYLSNQFSWLASGRVSTRPERMCVFPLRPGLLSEKTA